MKVLLGFFLLITSFGWTQVEPYQEFTSKGKKTSYKKMMIELQKVDVVLFGELNNNDIAHYFHVKVSKSITEHPSKRLIISAEMFERDQAEILRNYVEGNIDEKEFEKEMRLWSNYKTDYKP